MFATTRLPLILSTFGLALGADQCSKFLACRWLEDGKILSFLVDTLRLHLVQNENGFLGVFAVLPEYFRFILLTFGVAFLLLCAAIYLLLSPTLPRYQIITICLILAGGVSNLVDRLLHPGGVIDFLNIGIGWLRTGIFNLADMYILFGSFYLGTMLATTKESRTP